MGGLELLIIGGVILVISMSRSSGGNGGGGNGGGQGHNVSPGIIYYFTYTGPENNLVEAVGEEFWSKVWYLQIWDAQYEDWATPVDPYQYNLQTGALVKLQVNEAAVLYGFNYEGEE